MNPGDGGSKVRVDELDTTKGPNAMSLFTLPAALFALVFTADAAPTGKSHEIHAGKVMGLCAQIECTAEQKEKIAEIRAELREDLKANSVEMKSLAHAYAAEFRKDALNESMLESLRARMDATSDRRIEEVQEAMTALHAVLAPNQRDKVADRIEERGPGAAFHGHGHGGKGKHKGRDRGSKADRPDEGKRGDDAKRLDKSKRDKKSERDKKAERVKKAERAKKAERLERSKKLARLAK
jgi:Spy/CpxP family protein refolding chaperone